MPLEEESQAFKKVMLDRALGLIDDDETSDELERLEQRYHKPVQIPENERIM